MENFENLSFDLSYKNWNSENVCVDDLISGNGWTV